MRSCWLWCLAGMYGVARFSQKADATPPAEESRRRPAQPDHGVQASRTRRLRRTRAPKNQANPNTGATVDHDRMLAEAVSVSQYSSGLKGSGQPRAVPGDLRTHLRRRGAAENVACIQRAAQAQQVVHVLFDAGLNCAAPPAAAPIGRPGANRGLDRVRHRLVGVAEGRPFFTR